MLKFFIKNLFSCKALFLLFFSANISYCLADNFNLKKIEIIGEQRLSESFIKKFVPNLKDVIINNQELNNLTKKLYMTGFFSNVELKIIENTLKITVKELPIINAVSFSGNDFLNDDQLNSIVSIAPREIFNKEILNLAIERIRSEYQKSGRYLAEVNVKKNDLSKGRINLNFEIKEGMPLVVKNINFLGNEVFSDSVLKSKLSTKEDAWYKLFGSNKFVPERLEFDKENLKTFYNQRGYIDFKVEIARGDLLPDLSGFNLNFVINEGPRYIVNNINIQTKLIDKPTTSLSEDLFIKKGDFFDSRALDESKKYLNEYFVNLGYSFVKLKSSIIKNENLVNVNFIISKGDEKYVNKINILGNTRTNDSVIRRELSFVEGDAFSRSQLLSSINSIKRLGYFQSVNYKIEENSQNDYLDIILTVKEMNTGNVSMGVGYSSLNNTTVNFGLNEKNFLGEGNKVRFEVSLSNQKNSYNIGTTNPYFMDRPLSISFDIYNEESENTKGDVESSSSGFALGLGTKNNQWYKQLKYNYYSSETTTSTTSTANSITGEEGEEIITSSMTYRISKDTRDNYINPKSGYLISFANTLAGFGGDSTFIKSALKSKAFYPINYGDYILGFKSGIGFVNSLDDKITSSNRFRLGGKTLRGFDNTGVGPRDTGNNQVVGGNNFYNVSVELSSDKWMPSDTGLNWLVFSDMGSIWGTDYEAGVQGYDDIAPRITYGFGLSMITPVGPLQMIWGFPIQSENYDLEESFQFSIGTSF
ncbi:outer membrane protein assembly factor BamA [Alphaproteobacteria bacterium]|nr:outer membrane protein assembly factor BamA [Alphaproteobacteria bacterium]